MVNNIFLNEGIYNKLIDSNPCVEVYHLIGWIPEILIISEISVKETLWTRLYQNFNDGK